jgi:hypothetical protein
VALSLVQAVRPDLLVHRLQCESQPNASSNDECLRFGHELIADHDQIYAMTFSRNPTQANARASDLPGWLTGTERLADSPDADIWAVEYKP